jgi:predicted DNA-binding antitoxin AbrB/MazE fold protein
MSDILHDDGLVFHAELFLPDKTFLSSLDGFSPLIPAWLWRRGRIEKTVISSTEAKLMVYRGRVENGVIRLENAPTLPEGVEVEVRLRTENTSTEGEEGIPSVCEALKDFVGKAEGLPADASVNLDHYLYGLPKRQ